MVLAQTESRFAPDTRTAVWDFDIQTEGAKPAVVVSTDNPEALEALRAAWLERNISIELRARVLPADDPAALEKPWALVSVPVASLTGKPAFASAVTTQALMGTPLRVLAFSRPFWRVQTPDGYIGWVHGLQIERLSADALSDWNRSKRLIVTAPAASVTDAAGRVIARPGLGSILKHISPSDTTFSVQLPDGRIGRLARAAAADAEAYFKEWEKLRTQHPEQFWLRFCALAEQFLGVPYVWGGMSAGGVDCSGLVALLWRLTGVITQRDADQMAAQAHPVPFDRLEAIPAGFLLFFGKTGDDGQKRIEHVGISLGNGDFVHALGSVRIESLSEASANYNAYERARFLEAAYLDPALADIACASTVFTNGFYQPRPGRLPVCRP